MSGVLMCLLLSEEGKDGGAYECLVATVLLYHVADKACSRYFAFRDERLIPVFVTDDNRAAYVVITFFREGNCGVCLLG